MKKVFSFLVIIATAIIFLSCNKADNSVIGDSGNGKGGDITAAPRITSISASSAEIGDEITINGTNFGTKKNSSYYVTVIGKQASVYKSWSNTQIKILVPSGNTSSSGKIFLTLNRSYSNQVDFTINQSSPITIGNQTWMGYNLDVTKYRNNDPIPQCTSQNEWDGLTTGAWCYYNFDPAYGPIYGKLYNWYAVNDSRGLAPQGWHVPTESEWITLSIELGMHPDTAALTNGYHGTNEGGKLKEVGTSLWYTGYQATNETGFTALPGGWNGMVYSVTGFYYLTSFASFWSATEADATWAWMRGVAANSGGILHRTLPKYSGMSVRCIQDN